MLGSSLTTTTILATTTVFITILATQPSANADPQPTMPLPSSEGCGLVFVFGDGEIRREGGPKTWEAQHGGRQQLAPLSSLEGCVPARSRSTEGYGMEGHQQELGRLVHHETSHDVRHGSFSSFLIPDPTLTT